jgi:NAD(P)-dependent dehydrogenase (short-subunit alcohol dehydrogenase family)
MGIKGTSALVTGAGRGIGRAISHELARAGARVLVVSRTQPDLDSLVDEIKRGGGQAEAFAGDLRDRRSCDEAVAAAVAAHGRLQILVNNAGVGIHVPFAETSDEQWDQVIGTNLNAVFWLTRAALPHLQDGGGHVVMISSLAGQNPVAGMSAYCASKAALDHLTACLMLEVRHHAVKVTTVAPGSVATGFGTDAGSAPAASEWKLRAEDVAAQVLSLLEARHEAHSSRVEMRPLRPPRR